MNLINKYIHYKGNALSTFFLIEASTDPCLQCQDGQEWLQSGP